MAAGVRCVYSAARTGVCNHGPGHERAHSHKRSAPVSLCLMIGFWPSRLASRRASPSSRSSRFRRSQKTATRSTSFGFTQASTALFVSRAVLTGHSAFRTQCDLEPCRTVRTHSLKCPRLAAPANTLLSSSSGGSYGGLAQSVRPPWSTRWPRPSIAPGPHSVHQITVAKAD